MVFYSYDPDDPNSLGGAYPETLFVSDDGAIWIGFFGQGLLFSSPFTFLAFFIHSISSIAEINRIPFDIPEAESELVAGYNIEYSGMRFGAFFAAEFGNIYVVSGVATTCFLGGWQIPLVDKVEMLETIGLILYTIELNK